MKPSDTNPGDGNPDLSSFICERYEEAIGAGQPVAIPSLLREVSAALQNDLLEKLLLIQLKHAQRSGMVPLVADYLAQFPDRKEVVLRVFRGVNSSEAITNESEPEPAEDDVNTRTLIGGYDSETADTILNEIAEGIPDKEMLLDAIFPAYPDGKAYIVKEEIDRGGMGVVLKVMDKDLQRTLALKVIRGQERSDGRSGFQFSQGLMARFIREAQVTGQLDHPGVVPIHELATDREGRMYFTMKYVQGQTLSKVIPEVRNPSSQWNLTRVLEVLIRVCDTLAFAHSKNIIHRDLKPANIMVGEFGEAYVMDWGLAKILGEADQTDKPSAQSAALIEISLELAAHSPSSSQSQSQTMYGDVVGTAYYMPPEQAAGLIDELDPRSDVYSVGAVLYEILAGQSPYRKGNRPGREIISDVLQGPPKPIRELSRKAPAELIAIAEKAMSRNKADRYSSMADMADDVRAYLSQRVVSAYQSGMIAQLRKWVIRNQSVTIAGLLTLMTIVGALAVVAFVQFRNSNAMTIKNRELTDTVQQKEKAIEDAKIAAGKEKAARDEVNGLSLMNHSRNVLAQGDATLASLLGLESVARFPRATTIETLYSAVAELVDFTELDVSGRTAALVWSPDNRRLLSVCLDGTGTVWDTETNKAAAIIFNSGQQAFWSAQFSSDGELILAAGRGGTVTLFDARTGVRKLAMIVGDHGVKMPSGAVARPDVISAAFCVNSGTGEREARIAAASQAGIVYLLDGRTGRELAVLRPPGETTEYEFTTMSVSPDGHHIVTGCQDGSVFVWDDQQRLVNVIDAHKQPVQSISFSPDGTLFMTCAFATQNGDVNCQSAARCWHTETGDLQSEAAPEGTHVCNAVFHPTGSVLALGLSDRRLCLWDVEKQQVLGMSKPHDDVIRLLDFSDSGDRLVTVSNSGALMTWDVQTREGTARLAFGRRLYDESGRIHRIASGGSDLRIASATPNDVRIWNTGYQNAIPAIGSVSGTGHVYFSHRGDRILELNGAENKMRLFSYPVIRLISEWTFAANFLSGGFSEDDLHFAASFGDGACRLWDSSTGELQFETQVPEPAFFAGCSGSRMWIATEADMSVWDWKSRQLLGRIRDPKFGKLRISPDGQVILGQRQNRTEGSMVHFDPAGDLNSPQEIEQSETCNPGFFSKSGRYFWIHGPQHPNFAIPFSSHVKVIDTQANRVLFSTQAGDVLVRTVFLNDTDTRLLVNYVDHAEYTAEIYSIPEGKLITRIGPPKGEVISWSGDLQYVVTRLSDGRVTQLWDTSTGEIAAGLDITGSSCRHVTFSPDHRYFAVGLVSQSDGSGEESGRVAIWRIDSMSLMTMVPGEHQCDQFTAFLPDGKNFWTLSGENQVRLWPLDTIECARKNIRRTLTLDEQRMYGIDEIRQVPTGIPVALPSRRLQWNLLSDRIRLLAPVTAERRKAADGLVADVEKWLDEEATPEEISVALKAVDLLRSGPYETDPLVLSRIAGLHKKFGDPISAVQLLEQAARHPRAYELESKVVPARKKIAPRLVSLRSADALADAAFDTAAGADDKAAFENAMNPAAGNSRQMTDYLKARQLMDERKFEQAESLLQRLAETSLTDWPESGPELFLHLADCRLELGQPEAAVAGLRTALNEERFRAPEVWNRWLQLSFSELNLTPTQLLVQLPEKIKGIAPEPRYEEHVSWLLDQLSQEKPIRINCGGDRYFAPDGSVWESDRFYTFGFGYFGTDAEPSVSAEPIANTNVPLLYQSELWFSNDRRDAPAGYRIPLSNGVYRVQIGFAEIYAADRLFDVLLEDIPALTGYDPGRGAWATADDIIVSNAVVNDGQLDITFIHRNVESPKVSCLQITRVNSVAPAD